MNGKAVRAAAIVEAAGGLPARRCAMEILVRVHRDRAFADVLLGQRLGAFSATDRRLVTRLVLGTLAWQGRLDYELAHRLARKLGTLELELLVILRLGLFQLRLLTRIPPHAAVDTSVTLARSVGMERVSGLVNAVLRNAIRSPVSLPPRSTNEVEYLSVAHSHPQWLVEKFVEWHGVAAAECLMEANNQPAPNAVRLNSARAEVNEIVARMERKGMTIVRRGRIPETAIIDGAPIFGSEWRGGFFHAQAEASQLIPRMLAPEDGSLIIDCAAAPGGKTTHLAELAGPSAKVIALDLNFTGLVNARRVAKRLRHGNVYFARADGREPLPIRPSSANSVLLDAPCTGLGTLREHPEIRWRLSPADIPRMALLQSKMLENAAALVCRGGVLVYSVCSMAPQEGSDLVRAFLGRNPAFEVDRLPPAAAMLKTLLDREGFLRTSPDSGSLDGFFAARLRRKL